MPALNFQKQFAPLVESGEKRQTIRAYRKDGRDPKPGDTLYLYTGMRTKACRKIGEVKCKDAERIHIWVANMAVGDRHGSTGSQCNAMAVADGFADFGEMLKWFEKTHGLPFEGVLIRW